MNHASWRVAAWGLAAMVGALMPGTAAAVMQSPSPYASIASAVTTEGGLRTFTYTVSYAKPSEVSGLTVTYYTLDRFEIPEYARGDLVASVLPSGWSVTENASSTFSGTGIKSGAEPGAFLLLSTRMGNGAIDGENSLSFRFTTALAGSSNANFGLQANSQMYSYQTNRFSTDVYEVSYVDPLIPMGVPSAAAVPEPGSMLLLGGGLVSAGMLRRRGAARRPGPGAGPVQP